MSCCSSPTPEENNSKTPSCHVEKGKVDKLLLGSMLAVAVLYGQFWLLPQSTEFALWYAVLAQTVFELMNTMWIGIALGIVMLALLSKIPREFIMSVLGTASNSGEGAGFKGIFRATAAGVMLDMCNHGLLMVGAKLYERGATLGQVMAFLIASPWNSFSLTLVLITLVGFGWTLGFILISMIIAIVTGLLFDALVTRGTLPKNTNTSSLPDDFKFWPEAKTQFKQVEWSAAFIGEMLTQGIKDSRMVIRWILFGIVLAGLVRALVPTEYFATYFGPTLAGLGLTVLAATIMEVCSEGSTPIAADLLTRAKAPGNSFAFLMSGVSTDYTEIMVMRDATKSLKASLFLPLLTLPQVLFIAWLINAAAMP